MPKLLLDANVSWRLVSRLQPVFGFCEHVDHTSLPVPATDIQIWAYF
jgi:predicted nuclease of predicted toxin-antitoxin system